MRMVGEREVEEKGEEEAVVEVVAWEQWGKN